MEVKTLTSNNKIIQDFYLSRHTYYVILAWKLINKSLVENNLVDQRELLKTNDYIIKKVSNDISNNKTFDYEKELNNQEMMKPKIIQTVCDMIAYCWESDVNIFELFEIKKEKLVRNLEEENYMNEIINLLKENFKCEIDNKMVLELETKIFNLN